MTSDELAQLRGMLAAAPIDFSSNAQEVRAVFDGMIATFPVDESYSFVEKTIGGVSGLWLDAPKKSANVMLYIHGGAMLVGNTFGYRGLSGNLAQASGVNMFSIDYRLAPEHQFPAALDDCHAAYEGLLADVNAAILLGRPLLVKGEPGTGKTVLAAAVAEALGMPLLTWTVKSTTKAVDGLYHYDVVQRLNDARFGEGDVRDIRRYIRMGVLGQAFAAESRATPSAPGPPNAASAVSAGAGSVGGADCVCSRHPALGARSRIRTRSPSRGLP
jgi:hypothetical protein